ncbi:Starch-binding associating with outer membrane [bacterium A37T11]|nr:Starch-binding associating with outer membrane [bacterium A37T11]
MKKQIIHLTTIASLFLISACSKFLDRDPLSQAAENTYWQTAEDASAGLNAVYTTLPNSRDFWRDCESDNSAMTNAYGEGGLGYVGMGSFSATDNYVLEEWKYDFIRTELYFIDKLKGMNIDASIKTQYDAEARFMLAMRYFRMVQHFGDVPLIKEKPVDLDSAALPRSPKQDVLNYALENVETAIAAGLTDKDESGHITNAAAYMLRANIYLYMASYKKFHDGTDNPALWKEAAASADKVTAMGYALESDYSSLFKHESNNNNSEVILAYQYVKDKITHILPLLASPAGTGITGQGWASFCPGRDLVDSYECTDGKSIQESSIYDKNNPWNNRDKRLKQTFMLPGVDVLRPDGTYSPYQPHPSYNMTEKMNSEGGGLTGFMYLKFNEPTFTQPDLSYTNWPIYRYSETLLILAEALNEYDPTNPRIVWAINQVRTRAGLPGVDAYLGNQEIMRTIIRNERRHEFVAEHKRYFDILRWKTAEDVLTTIYGINSNVSDAIGDYTKPKFVAQVRTFNASKHYLWPVPQTAIDKNPNLLPQNPNW